MKRFPAIPKNWQKLGWFLVIMTHLKVGPDPFWSKVFCAQIFGPVEGVSSGDVEIWTSKQLVQTIQVLIFVYLDHVA